MTPLCIDIETRPNYVSDEELRAIALASKANPKRNEESRAQWADDPENQVEAWSRESLSIVGARICAIAIQGEDVRHAWADCMDERRLVEALAVVLRGLSGPFVWIGHNITAFDLPILRMAAMRHDMPGLRRLLPSYRYDKAIHDNMAKAVEPAGSYSGVTADALALALGLEGKGDLAELDFGSLYADMLQAIDNDASEQLQKVEDIFRARCQRDADVEWRTYLRMTK